LNTNEVQEFLMHRLFWYILDYFPDTHYVLGISEQKHFWRGVLYKGLLTTKRYKGFWRFSENMSNGPVRRRHFGDGRFGDGHFGDGLLINVVAYKF